ncbi:hypothetical protein [Bacillus sp. B1-b2]|uniref:hypothetical protein n=1 Tax=Bacillus sp. B1-b2 TaxID=2653201 RepID=UPI0012614A18|nr:hypothetical protein [Bacillus sp. B1-b2]KAB7672466.1 hypothetical protein F9279_02220 [Bacillus sp. B1-b2]
MKNPIIAIILAFFPGGGLFYIGNKIRGFLYGLAVFGLALLSIIVQVSFYDGRLTFIIIVVGFILYCISFIDTLITTSRYLKERVHYTDAANLGTEEQLLIKTVESERFYSIVLSFVPGLGHIQLGLVYRGITLLTTFLGLGIMILFVTFLTQTEEFLLFLAILPVIWIYGFYDVTQQFNKKQDGYELEDITIFQEFEKTKEDGKKSKFLATFLSVFPGAGHLYLGLQQRGIQLMAAFLFSIFILNELRLGLFLFVIPIIWFYSFFDGLQKASKVGEEELEDIPVVAYLINYQKWIGIGLFVVGFYYLLVNVVLPIFSPKIRDIFDIDVRFLFYQYFQTGLVCLLLIIGGVRLLTGTKKKQK